MDVKTASIQPQYVYDPKEDKSKGQQKDATLPAKPVENSGSKAHKKLLTPKDEEFFYRVHS